MDARGQLVERIAQSRYIAKSVRLHDLLVYLCDRVINEGADEIHEQEVGHAVFERPKDYDTALDNIVRVHASTLRKRLEQFFSEEGLDEPIVIELPKGNYAPVFRERTPVVAVAAPVAPLPVVVDPLPIEEPRPRRDVRFLVTAALALVFAIWTCVLLLWRPAPVPVATAPLPGAVRDFWSGVFVRGQKADIVLDDAALGLYEELDGRPIALSEYFDRSYQRRLSDKPELKAVILKRQSSYASVSLLAGFSHMAAAMGSDWAPRFARDYAFRDLKSNRAILLGNSRSNPWIEPFESKLGVRWVYDSASGVYYPVDSWNGSKALQPGSEHPDGYASIALLPNAGGTGSIVIISGTGGAAISAAGAFLQDGNGMAELRAKLPAGKSGEFPYFEALLKSPSRSRLPKDAEILICRPARN